MPCRLDVLVNNTGIFIAIAETDDYRIEDFDRTVRNNLRTAFLMNKCDASRLFSMW